MSTDTPDGYEPVIYHGITLFHRCVSACGEGSHDWSGPGIERELPGGGGESTSTCAKCGIELVHWPAP
jgi:hypothetical protein